MRKYEEIKEGKKNKKTRRPIKRRIKIKNAITKINERKTAMRRGKKMKRKRRIK